MLVEVYDAFRNREIVRVRNFVQQIENQTEYLKLCQLLLLSSRIRETYLIPQASLLYYVHANVQNVLHQLLALARRASGLLALLLLGLASLKEAFTKNVKIPCLDSDADHLLIIAILVAALEYPPYSCLQVLLYATLEDKGRGVCSYDTSVAATRQVGVESVGIIAR